MTAPADTRSPALHGARRLDGRRLLVAGGAAGIGRSCALRLAADGAAVVVADIAVDRAQAVVDEIRASGGAAHVVELDVTDEAIVAAACESAAAVMGGLDGIVCCVGIVDGAPTHELPLDRWELVLRVNLTGTFLVIKHGLPHLVAAGGGAIVTTGSVASIVAAGAAASYDASKGGVLQLTRAVARAYAADGIRANCLCPGAVRTDIFANSTEVLGAEPARGGLTVDPPMRRFGDPSEIAAVAAFLVSDDSSFMTGSAVMADGGFTAI